MSQPAWTGKYFVLLIYCSKAERDKWKVPTAQGATDTGGKGSPWSTSLKSRVRNKACGAMSLMHSKWLKIRTNLLSWVGWKTVDHAAAFIGQARVVNMLMGTSGWIIHKQRKRTKKKKKKGGSRRAGTPLTGDTAFKLFSAPGMVVVCSLSCTCAHAHQQFFCSARSPALRRTCNAQR